MRLRQQAALSIDQLSHYHLSIEMMKRSKNNNAADEEIDDLAGIQSPVQRVYKLLVADKVSDIVNNEILNEAINRVTQNKTGEKCAIIDCTGLSIKPIQTCSPTSVNILSDIEMFHGRSADARLQRPKALTAILSLLSKAEVQAERTYSKFLQSADLSQEEIVNACIKITPSYMYTSSDTDTKKKIIQNSSLLEIFASYSKIFNPAYKDLSTPLDREDCVATIHIQELLQFTEDFEIYPRLLSKADIKFLWSAVSLETCKRKPARVFGLNLEGFKDILVRIALLAYHRPRAKELILRLNSGIMPSHLELIEYICRYLHLDDQHWVMMHIKKKNDQLKIPVKCTFGLLCSNSVLTIPSDERGEKILKLVTQIPFFVKGADASALPFLKSRSRVQKIKEDIMERERKPVVIPCTVEIMFHDMKQPDSSTVTFESYLNNENNTGTGSTPLKSSGGHPGNMTDEQRHFLSCKIEAAAIRCFKKYTCETVDRMQNRSSDWFYSGGNFIDMGCLPSGAECVICLSIMNCASDELYLDVSTTGLDSSDARIISEPSPVIPGLSKIFRILFTVEPGERSVMGYVQVIAICVRTGFTECVHTPVHYRIGSPNPERDDCPYTIHMKQSPIEGIIDYRRNSLNFETKRRNHVDCSQTGGFDLTRSTINTDANKQSTNQQIFLHSSSSSLLF